MSGLQLWNPPSNNLNKTKMVNNGTNTTTNLILPSFINPTSQHTPMKVSFTFDVSLKQASVITPGTATQNDSDEDDTIEIYWTVKKGGTYRNMVGLTSVNDHQAKDKSNLADFKNTTVYDAFIPKVSPASPFAKVCFEVGSRSNLVMSAQTSTQILKNLYGVGVNISPENCIQSLGEQLAPFPLLAVMYPGNKVVLLHSLH